MKRLTTLFAALLFYAGAATVSAVSAATPLVDAGWAEANIGNPDVVFLDVRGKLGGQSKNDYLKAHVPGAVWTDYLKDGWRAKDAKGTAGQLPPIEALEALIGGLGIANGDHVVVIPVGGKALDVGTATRIYWTFKVLGHDRVSILDGGMNGYLAGGRPTASGEETRPAATFDGTLRAEMIATKEDMKALSANGGLIVDNRPAKQYRGEAKHKLAARAGTIPGAKNVPESQLTNAGIASFKDTATLQALYADAGVAADAEQVSFCNTGHWASLGWFVSSELLGNTRARMYDGSMVEWSADRNLPIQRAAN